MLHEKIPSNKKTERPLYLQGDKKILHIFIYNFFINNFYLNHNKNNSNNNKNKNLFKMTTICFDTCFQSPWEVIDDLLQCINADFIPRLDQSALQRFNCRVGLRTRFFFKNTPHRIVQGVQIRWAGWPLAIGTSPMGIDFDEVRAVFAEELLGLNGFVPRGPVLLKAPPAVPEMLLCPVFFQHVHVD